MDDLNTKVSNKAQTPPIANVLLADAADTEEARNFLLAHDSMTLMLWNRNSLNDKIKWIEHLMPKENPRPFWSECIRLLKAGYS